MLLIRPKLQCVGHESMTVNFGHLLPFVFFFFVVVSKAMFRSYEFFIHAWKLNNLPRIYVKFIRFEPGLKSKLFVIV